MLIIWHLMRALHRRDPIAVCPIPALCMLVMLGFFSAGCTSPSSPKAAGLVVTVPHVERLDVSAFHGNSTAINRVLSRRAESFAQMIDRGSVWYGEGLSMEPLIKPGSWIVTRPRPFDQLEPGMVVLYTNSTGRQIVHALLLKTQEGWLVAGVNNRYADREFVTAANYGGVIIAVFAPAN